MGSTGLVSRFLTLLAVAAGMAMLSACGGGGDGGSSEPVRSITSVTVTSPTLTPKQGETVQLTAVARDQFGDVVPGTATWSSSAPSVATVSSMGVLQALAGGSVVVTATINGVSGSLSLTVTPRVTTTVTVTSPTLTPQVGATVPLTVEARDQFGDTIPGKTATWSSSAPVIATVSPTGQLQALAPGAVLVTATIDGVSGTLWLTVAPRTVALVTVTGPTSTPKEGDTVQLTATARDEFGNIIPGTTATWSSSDQNVAVVSTTGLVQTLATGTVAVTATINGVWGVQSLTISAIKVSVTIGAKEVVFDYTTDRCETLDVPDQPARFVRAGDGNLVLVDGNAPRHYVSRGADFSSLKRDCGQPAVVSADRPHSRDVRELGMAMGRLSRRKPVARADPQRVPRCCFKHLPGGRSFARQSLLVQLDHVCSVHRRRSVILETLGAGARRGACAECVGTSADKYAAEWVLLR